MTFVNLRSDLCGGRPDSDLSPLTSAAVLAKLPWHSQKFYQWGLAPRFVPPHANYVMYTNRMPVVDGELTNVGTCALIADIRNEEQREWVVNRAAEIIAAGDEVVMKFKPHQWKQQYWVGGNMIPTLEAMIAHGPDTFWSAEPLHYTARNAITGFALILQELVRREIPFSMIVGHAWTPDPDRTHWIDRALLWLSTAATTVYVDELPEGE